MEKTLDNYTIPDFFISLPKEVKELSNQEKKPRSRREELLHELYLLLISQPEETKKENRKRYRLWMHNNYPEHCLKRGFDVNKYNSFKDEFREVSNKGKLPKEERFLSYPKEDNYLWYGRFSHLKGESGIEALEHMLHEARGMKHRGYQVAPYIMGSVKEKKALLCIL